MAYKCEKNNNTLQVTVSGINKLNEQVSVYCDVHNKIVDKAITYILFDFSDAILKLKLIDVAEVITKISNHWKKNSHIEKIVVIPGADRPRLDMINVKLMHLKYPVYVCESSSEVQQQLVC